MLAMLFFVYLIFIVLTSDPLERMNRICSPVTHWPARIIVSGARIFAPSTADGLQNRFDSGFYTCRKWVWGALYAEDYKQAKAQSENAKSVSALPAASDEQSQ